MIDIKLIQNNPDIVKESLAKRNSDINLDEIIDLDRNRVKLIQRIEELRAQRNKISKTDSPENREMNKEIKEKIKELEPELKSAEENLQTLLSLVPNIVSPKSPVGKDESENVTVKTWGDKPTFDFTPKDHLELGKQLGLLDFERGAKVAGSQFYYLKNEAVLLELALAHYAIEILVKEGFTPFFTPDVAKSKYYLGTGYQPKGPEAQIYKIENNDLGLIATAEITLAGLHADEIVNEADLPKKYVGYSHCFRVEAGGYGKYSKGLYRVHQFTKIEMFIYCRPDESEKMHEYLLSLEEKIYQGLKLPYRVLEMCTGDLGSQAARKFDIEAWMPGRNDYGEVTSTSNCTDYQARNLGIKMRKNDGTTEYLHMLNGTAVATSRAIIAILENYQQEDGSVIVPEVLRQFVGKDQIQR